MRPTQRLRPITVRPRPKKWYRDHVGLETLTSLSKLHLITSILSKFYWTYAETVISQLSILTSPLDSAINFLTDISKLFGKQTFLVFFSFYRSNICRISISGLFDVMISNTNHTLLSALGWFLRSLNSVSLPVPDLYKVLVMSLKWWHVTSRCDADLWPFNLERL